MILLQNLATLRALSSASAIPSRVDHGDLCVGPTHRHAQASRPSGRDGQGRVRGFFRAINVSGANVIKMDELKRLFTKAGATDVVTYIQSGNVAFNLPQGTLESDFVSKIEGSLASAGINSVVIMRSKAELESIARRMAEVWAENGPSRGARAH